MIPGCRRRPGRACPGSISPRPHAAGAGQGRTRSSGPPEVEPGVEAVDRRPSRRPGLAGARVGLERKPLEPADGRIVAEDDLGRLKEAVKEIADRGPSASPSRGSGSGRRPRRRTGRPRRPAGRPTRTRRSAGRAQARGARSLAPARPRYRPRRGRRAHGSAGARRSASGRCRSRFPGSGLRGRGTPRPPRRTRGEAAPRPRSRKPTDVRTAPGSWRWP